MSGFFFSFVYYIFIFRRDFVRARLTSRAKDRKRRRSTISGEWYGSRMSPLLLWLLHSKKEAKYTIIYLCRKEEKKCASYLYVLFNLQPKCAQYWPPAQTENYGLIQVSLSDEKQFDCYVGRQLFVTCVSFKCRVLHSWFPIWNCCHSHRGCEQKEWHKCTSRNGLILAVLRIRTHLSPSSVLCEEKLNF